ncbi:MAG: precorrin-6A/cobalt-precorrin-6A reductase [Faecalibacterium prausnitzii]
MRKAPCLPGCAWCLKPQRRRQNIWPGQRAISCLPPVPRSWLPFAVRWNRRGFYPRVLPTPEGIAACEAADVPHRNIIAMQGPFSLCAELRR